MDPVKDALNKDELIDAHAVALAHSAHLEVKHRARARTALRRLQVLALFMLACFLVLAYLQQVQQTRLKHYVNQMCHTRQLEILKNNASWDGLARIEQDNPATDDRARAARVALYQDAVASVPSC